MKGLALSRAFYRDIIANLMPSVPYAAAFLGPGSDVLGFDDAVSTDHDWGPRLKIFVASESEIPAAMSALEKMPQEFAGYPVWYGRAEDGVMVKGGSGERQSLVRIHTIENYLDMYLGIARPETDMDWLALPDQRLLEWTSGEVFHDDIGLKSARDRFAWLPENVWYYRMAAVWSAISEEAAFVGRTGDVGDNIGYRVISARLIRRAMILAFLLERTYPPYMKWLGTAFRRLRIAGQMGPIIDQILAADNWKASVMGFGKLWDMLILRQSEVIKRRIAIAPAPYRNDYWTHDFAPVVAAIREFLQPPLTDLPPGLGSVNEWLDNTPVQRSSKQIAHDLKQILLPYRPSDNAECLGDNDVWPGSLASNRE